MTIVSDILNTLINSKSVPIEKLKSISVSYQSVSGRDIRDGFFEEIKPRVDLEFYEDETND